MKKKLVIWALTAALAFSIPCGSAFASDHDASKETGNTVSTMADSSKVEMKVITKVGSHKYSYNSKGLVTKANLVTVSYTYKYSSKNSIKSYVEKNIASKPHVKTTVTVKRNKKGKVSQLVAKANKYHKKATQTFKYNKKGLVTSIKVSGDKKYALPRYYSYDKNGNVSKAKSKYYVDTFKYDSNGMIVSGVSKDPFDKSYASYTYYKNNYKDGYLVSREITQKTKMAGFKGLLESAPWTEKITYKTIMVPKDLVSKVKHQQEGILGVSVEALL